MSNENELGTMDPAEIRAELARENDRLRKKNVEIEQRIKEERKQHKGLIEGEKHRADGFIVKRDRAVANLSNWKTANENLAHRLKVAEARVSKGGRNKMRPEVVPKKEYTDKVDAIGNAIERARAAILLHDIQWSGRSFLGLKRCPKCGCRKSKGHRSDCEVFTVLEQNK